jgi:hypothetical protein
MTAPAPEAEQIEHSELRKVIKLAQRRTQMKFGSWWFLFMLSVFASHTLEKVTFSCHCETSSSSSSSISFDFSLEMKISLVETVVCVACESECTDDVHVVMMSIVMQRREEVERLQSEKREMEEMLAFHLQRVKRKDQETKAERMEKGMHA